VGESGDKDAGEQIDDTLEVHDGDVISSTEERETCGEEERISGQADEGRGNATWGLGEAVDAVLQPVSGDVAVDAPGMSDEPEAQHKASRQCQYRTQTHLHSTADHVCASYCRRSRADRRVVLWKRRRFLHYVSNECDPVGMTGVGRG
jgi:hypothetical protein